MSEPLGSLAKIHYGKSPSEVLVADGDVPVVGTGGPYAKAGRAMFEQGIVVARKGSLGTPHLMTRPFWPSDTTFAVLPNPGIEIRWLYFNLLNFDLAKLNEATGVPSISRDWLEKIRFHKLEGNQQQKIAAILGSIDEAIERTEALIAKYRQIKAGLMHDLFTRGVLPNGQLRPPREQAPDLYRETVIGWIPKEWDVETLESLLAHVPNNIRSGPFGSALLKHELVEDGIPFLGIDNIYVERFDANFRRFVSERKFAALSRYRVRPRDVVITIMGTVGRCCIIPDNLELALSSKHLWTMTFDQAKVLPELICWQLNHSAWALAWFRRSMQGGIMDAIQSSTLKTLRLPVPRIDEQERILDRYSRITSRIDQDAERLNKLKIQKLGLMQDLLTGKVSVRVDEPPTERA
jgi:type I restriction enzyme S subunit